MNNAPWVPPSSAQVAVYMVWVPPLILTRCPMNTSQLDFRHFTVYYCGLYHLHLCIPSSVIGLKSLVAMVIWHWTALINLICTSCITKENFCFWSAHITPLHSTIAYQQLFASCANVRGD